MPKIRKACDICHEKKLKCIYDAGLKKCQRCHQLDTICEFSIIKRRATKLDGGRSAGEYENRHVEFDKVKQSVVWIPQFRSMCEQMLYLKNQLGHQDFRVEKIVYSLNITIKFFASTVNIIVGSPGIYEEHINPSDVLMLMTYAVQIAETINLAMKKIDWESSGMKVITDLREQMVKFSDKIEQINLSWPSESQDSMARMFAELLGRWIRELIGRCDSCLYANGSKGFDFPVLDFTALLASRSNT